ncbi:response regulator [Ketobacter sp. MCCC 1A13808]|uniref:ATP-binding protein n=1 Tax=Ketobacter sp. MCCC 1A13808 TaxID=2602738 RepID=UPI0012EC8BC9|nr:ATP-binding protein [Ketobacter sp. MCCC 1A13808]MVF14063.1 response regulator [Ketobacter sp. MCCC 1A13808]
MNKQSDTRFFIIAVIAILIVGSGLLVYESQSVQRGILKTTGDQLRDQLVVRHNMIQNSIESSALKVRFLFSTPPVSGLVRAAQNGGIDPLDSTPTERWKSRLKTIYIGFLENNPEIYQIRYIGEADSGKELIRVERRHSKISAAPDALLQSKGDQEYFQMIRKLPPGEVYVSDLNLNKEHGKLEYPYRPTYRVGMPVYDGEFQFFGLIIINVDAKFLLDPLEQNLHEEYVLYLLNTKDNFILHPNARNNFSFEFGDAPSWEGTFQEQASNGINEKLKQANEIETAQALYFLDSEIQLSGAESGRHLKLIIGMLAADVNEIAISQRNKLWLISGIVLILAIFLIAAYQHYISQKIDLSDTLSQYEAIVSGSSDAIVGMDKSAVVTSWNDTAQDMFGVSRRAAIGSSVFELFVTRESAASLQETMNKVLNGQLVVAFKIEAKRRNGSVFPVSVTLSPITGTKNSIPGVAAIIRDITDQVDIEAKLQNMNASLERQVAERTRELELARNEALSASKSKSEFVANISHEIRTPLNGVAGMLRLLRRGGLSEQQLHYLKMAENSSVILSALINDILDVSKIEAGKLDIEQEEFDLLRLMCDLALTMAIKAQDKKLEYILDVAEIKHRYLVGDSHRIRQILTNLIVNAIKFTEHGEVYVSMRTLEQSNGEVLVQGCVRDSGVGISEEGQRYLFDAFAQEDSSITRRFGGTGLGLSISRQLCRLMGGDISVVSKKGSGSAFSFDFRLSDSERAGNEVPFLELSERLIMIAHPNPTAAKTMALQLRIWKAKVEVYTGLLNALLKDVVAGAITPDVIILDQSLLDDSADLTILDQMTGARPNIMVAKEGGAGPALKTVQCPIEWLNKPVTPLDLGRRLSTALFSGQNIGQFERDDTEHHLDLAAFEPYAGTRILLVDDNEVNLEVAEGLISDIGLEISRAKDGQQALEIIEAQIRDPFKLVFMDCQMPVMDGYTATQAIRAGAAGVANKDVVVIAMTANAMAGDSDRCLQVGMNDYLTKPIDPQALELKLLYWLEHGSQSSKAGVILPDLEVLQGLGKDMAEPVSDKLVWDRAALLKRVRQSESRLAELVKIFLDMLPERRQRAEAAVVTRQLNDIANIAHSLKGSASSLGGMRVQYYSEQLELAAKSNDHNAIDLAWARLSASCDELAIVLQRGAA